MKQLYLVNVTGRDRSGVTAEIANILSESDARILDIGQALIHDNLSLGILVAFDDAYDSTSLRQAIADFVEKAQVQVQFDPVSLGDYQHWVEAQEQPRHIVTLLARSLSATQVARVGRIVARHGLNIDKINRLSGRVDLEADLNTAKACVEFSLRGEAADIRAVRADLLGIASELNVDIAYQEDNIYRRYRRLVVFDMDSTLIDAEVIDELAKEAGVGEEVARITEQAMRGELDFKQSFRRRLALLKGLPEPVLEQVAQRLELTEGAALLIRALKSLGYKTAILSGGFGYFARRLQTQLGIDYVYANELQIEQGKLTGEVQGEIVDGARKASLLEQIAAQEGIELEQVVAVGDGANDLPMLSLAGLGIAFRAKPIVKESAKQSISNLGLDSILYLIGFRDRDWLRD